MFGRAIRLLGEESGQLLVDLSGIYDGIATTIFRDRIHTKQKNQAVVARTIYQHIVKNFDTNSE